MARKTVKDLDNDFTHLKEEFHELKYKFDTLALNYEMLENKFNSLEIKYEESLSRKKEEFKCSQCDEKLQSLRDLRNHMKTHHYTGSSFQCKQCDRSFNEEWKINAHVKTHKSFSCDQCSKCFKYMDAKAKHVKVVHENVKLYCHYYNNNKQCPYKEECLFLHEASGKCKFGALCERTNCMFEHANDEENDANESVNTTFVNPLAAARTVDNLEEGPDELVEFNVFVPCRDMWLTNDKEFYTNELNKMREIEYVDYMWIKCQKDYCVGTYLSTEVRFVTKFSNQWKNDEAFRQIIWDRLQIKETCPE